jgi:hypothetical protein
MLHRGVSEEMAPRAGFYSRSELGEEASKRVLDPTSISNTAFHIFFGLEACGAANPQNKISSSDSAVSSASTSVAGKRPSLTLSDFDPYERGEAGVAPLLRGDFYRLINISVYENATFPKPCTPGAFSTTWSSMYDNMWQRMMTKASTRYSEGSLVDFVWHRIGEPVSSQSTRSNTYASSNSAAAATSNSSADNRDPYTNNMLSCAVSSSLPIDFDQVAYHSARGDSRDGWTMVIGCSTSGTCFRGARLLNRSDTWRANAISNLYFCPGACTYT